MKRSIGKDGGAARAESASKPTESKGKKEQLPLVLGKDNCGYCFECSPNCCGYCKWCKRCRLLTEVEVRVTNDNGSDYYYKVVVEAYRAKSAAKYAVWKHLKETSAHSSEGYPLCYSEAEALGFDNFIGFARSSRVENVTRLDSQYSIAAKIDGTLKRKVA